MEVLKRFESKLVKTDYCWNWTGGKSKGRTSYYGMFYLRKRYEKAHRASFKIFKGEIKEGMTIDHICGNTLCVNPEHLRSVTMYENATWNTRAGNFKMRDRCSNGHIYTKESTYLRKYKGNTWRQCRLCRKEGYWK